MRSVSFRLLSSAACCLISMPAFAQSADVPDEAERDTIVITAARTVLPPNALPLTEWRPNLPPLGALGQFSASAGLGRIPNVADYAAQGSIDYRVPAGRDDLRLGAWFKYIGPSRLGIGPRLGDKQGNYLDTGLAARLGDTRRGLTVSLTNLLDSKGNRFALGTPFDLEQGAFITPQRPRTLRIAFDYRY